MGINGRYRSFYLNDGCKYSWTSSSTKCLEKVINPNGGLEEKRFRVAKVKLMRQFKLDFEVLVDNKNIDPELRWQLLLLACLLNGGWKLY